ncbi:hypothetical protein HDU76_004971 [Blyttiomyces sp. JEL0837]|nr:hypothetical protein HDU76_004971 [Blyttiomyces sp. JEL0837]
MISHQHAPYRRRLFFGRKLPPEIQFIITEHAGPLTWLMNDLLTKDEIAEYSKELWREVFRIDWSGGLTKLPHKGFPTIRSGLGLVTSRSMYRHLCLLRPDLADLDLLEKRPQREEIWRWDTLDTHDNYYA